MPRTASATSQRGDRPNSYTVELDQLATRINNLCDHSTWTLQRDRRTAGGQTDITVLCVASRVDKTLHDQLVLWDPPVNYYSISRQQGSTSNPKHSVSWHQLSGTLCLQLLKVPLPSPLSRYIWKLNCLQLHTTRSNISSADGASDSNSLINVFDTWYLTLFSHLTSKSGPNSELRVRWSTLLPTYFGYLVLKFYRTSTKLRIYYGPETGASSARSANGPTRPHRLLWRGPPQQDQ